MTIPASALVQVNPSVLNAGGAALVFNGVFLSQNTRTPIGMPKLFANTPDVTKWYGAGSDEETAARIYFNGFENSSVKPGSLYFAQYNTTKVAAYLRGGSLLGTTLAQLQAMHGNLEINIDGFDYSTSTPIDLSAATSFTNAASIIQTALDALTPASATFTGALSVPPGSQGPTLNVSAVASGVIAIGGTVAGAGVLAGTIITKQISGTTGGIGVYGVNQGQIVASESMTSTSHAPTVAYDSVTSSFVISSGQTGIGSTIGYAKQNLSVQLLLQQDLGATLSQGAAASTPGAFMDQLAQYTQNWATFCLLFDPDGNNGNTQKLLFAAWVAAQGDRFAFIDWDDDLAPTVTVPATSSQGYILAQNESDGTCLISGQSYDKAAFICGAAASIDFTETNGRITFKAKSQSGLVPDVTDETTANNLTANGYNYYGAWATATEEFVGFAEGGVSGEFQWLDSYVNQIQLNTALQQALVNLIFQSKSIPYNAQGYALIEAACYDPINAALNFGSIRPGVPLSSAQAAEVNAAAGTKIDDIIGNVGWYLQVKPASAQTRQARLSPPCKFWYTDGQSVHFIDLSSTLIQ